MTLITILPKPITVELLEFLEDKGLLRLFKPTKLALQAPPGENIAESIYESADAYGPHKLIAVGVNKDIVRLGKHPGHEEFLIPPHGLEVKPLYLLICHLNEEAVRLKDREGTLTSEDFTCLSLYPAPRGAEMFTMLAGTLHCEVTESGEGPIGCFYVTESRDLPIEWIDLDTIRIEGGGRASSDEIKHKSIIR